MSRQGRAALAVAILLGGAAPARADEATCQPLLQPGASLPALSVLHESRSACAQSAAQVGLVSQAVVEEERVEGGLLLRYQHLSISGFDATIAALAVRHYTLAGEARTELGPVHLEVGLPKRLALWGLSGYWRQSLHVRVPFSASEDTRFSLVVRPQIETSIGLGKRAAWHSRIGILLRSRLGFSGPDSRVNPTASTSISSALGNRFGAGLGVQVSRDFVDVAATLRLAAGAASAVELSAQAPVALDESRDATVFLGVRWWDVPETKAEGARLRDWAF